MKLEDEIKQKKFSSIYHKALLNIHYTNNRLMEQVAEKLKPYNISTSQFNILRILRGKNPDPASLSYIKERMLDKMPDVSRMIEKMRMRGLIDRCVCPENRREVEIRITKEGLNLLKALDKVEHSFKDFFKSLTDNEVEHLNNLLDKMRD